MGLYCRLHTIISADALLSVDLGWLLPHWRRQPVLTWRDSPYFSTGMAVLRRVTREPPWLRRADGGVIRTGSVCEQQQRRQSQPLVLEAAVWTDDRREVRLSQKEDLFLCILQPVIFGGNQAFSRNKLMTEFRSMPLRAESHYVVSSGQEPGDFLASIPHMLESKACNFTHIQSNYIILILKMLHQNIFLHN